MRYIDFYKKFYNYPAINIADIKNIDPDFDHRRLYEWQKKGYITKIVNGIYVFADKKINDHELNFISNSLYKPSYISLEYALSYYGLIPETVFLYTCISTRKTKSIESTIGNFHYHKIKNSLFFGYTLIEKNNISFKIAEPEKALLDFLYLRSDIQNENDLFELRINEAVFKELVNIEKLNNYLKKFSSKKLNKIIKILYAQFS